MARRRVCLSVRSYCGGAPPASVTRAFDEDGEPRARAAIAGGALAFISVDERVELQTHFPAAHAEWIVLAVAMMGRRRPSSNGARDMQRDSRSVISNVALPACDLRLPSAISLDDRPCWQKMSFEPIFDVANESVTRNEQK
jgi:hypothetical protein